MSDIRTIRIQTIRSGTPSVVTVNRALNYISSTTGSDGTGEIYLHALRWDTSNGGPDELGEVAWNSTDGTLDLQVQGNVNLPIGETHLIRVRNTSGVPIAKGAALVYTGTPGASGKMEVAAWEGSNVTNARAFLGFAAGAMNNQTDSYACWIGKISEIDLDGGDQGEVWEDGQIIYAVPGASATLTNVEPTSGSYVIAAALLKAGSGTSGSLYARPTFADAGPAPAGAISDVATGGSATAAANASAINSILAALRTHGIISS